MVDLFFYESGFLLEFKIMSSVMLANDELWSIVLVESIRKKKRMKKST